MQRCVLEVRDESGSWEEFESRLLEKYGHDDALRLSKHDFMEWVETPGKGRTASALLREFDDRFARCREENRPWEESGKESASDRSVGLKGIRPARLTDHQHRRI
jgi:hypothetical protein